MLSKGDADGTQDVFSGVQSVGRGPGSAAGLYGDSSGPELGHRSELVARLVEAIPRRGSGAVGSRQLGPGGVASPARGGASTHHGAGDFKKSDGLLRQGVAMRYRFIEEH